MILSDLLHGVEDMAMAVADPGAGGAPVRAGEPQGNSYITFEYSGRDGGRYTRTLAEIAASCGQWFQILGSTP